MMTAKKTLGRLIEVEASEESARPRENHEKAGEATLGAADRDRSEGSPIDLRLLPWKDRETEEGFVSRGTSTRDEAPNGKYRTIVSAIAQHLMESRRAEAWMLLESGADEVTIRIE